MKKFQFEFVFRVNGHIICQRYFDIKAERDDFDFIRSLESKYLLKDIVSIIEGDMKMKAKRYLWENFNYVPDPNVEIEKNDLFSIGDQLFEVELKCGKRLIGKSIFLGNYYPSIIRKDIDIRSFLPNITNIISSFLSADNYTKVYCGYRL